MLMIRATRPSADIQKAATTSLIAGVASMAMQQGLQMVLQEALTSMLTDRRE